MRSSSDDKFRSVRRRRKNTWFTSRTYDGKRRNSTDIYNRRMHVFYNELTTYIRFLQ
uniref:Uncharacterized protein n=1 Tax=Zea mays TaxID=4577 RepID=B6TXQ9_MAIZE|nr:hypothetical protein [Zea mays]